LASAWGEGDSLGIGAWEVEAWMRGLGGDLEMGGTGSGGGREVLG